ncbi:antitoxin [Terrabacter sp. 2RAF25]|uniref:antitoxin n=1 Tax=Terrabacter sp. 2RAF25 TaxID=3232998 RepID=UPI003F9CAA2D
MDFNEIVDQAKNLAGEHPEQAKEALEKAEGILDERTGGKFTDQISKGGDAVEGQLGLPADNATDQ